jgi:hypothetical protein
MATGAIPGTVFFFSRFLNAQILFALISGFGTQALRGMVDKARSLHWRKA